MNTNTWTDTASVNQLLAAVEEVQEELLQLLLPLREAQLNKVPFANSWSAAQLATHVSKSNNGMAQALDMPGQPAQRKPGERVKELKDTFLNFSIKMQSPSFIVPAPGEYNKEAVITSLKKSNERVHAHAATADFNEMINLPAAFGEITKLELLHFVLYHTQRHNHQLENIIKQL